MEFEGNANRAKAEAKKPEADKKVEKVVKGEVSRRKKPLGKKISETFMGDSSQSVWDYIVMDVLIPSAKDTMADAVSQGVERMLFGEARSTSRRTGRRPETIHGSNGYVSYNRFGSPGPRTNSREERTVSRRARAAHDFDEIVLATRVEAEEVIDRMFDLISRYETVTVADLYELVGISGNYTDDKWGWTDLRGASVQRIRSGYVLDLPRPEPLN